MRIAMIGTRGVPARYGGFETCVEEVGSRLAEHGHAVTAYCRTEPDEPQPPRYRGMRLVHLPAVRRKTLETLSHTRLSVRHAVTAPPDAAFVFNAGNAPLVRVLKRRGVPVATHVDGLEWKRAKWSGLGATYYRFAERMAVRWSDYLIADARGIQDYYADKFGVLAEYIAYGTKILGDAAPHRLPEVDLQPNGYHLVVARFEPENHLHLSVAGYLRSGCRLPLVVVGSAPYSDAYTEFVQSLAADIPRVRFLGAVWDQELLDQLYAGALTYIHGHSVGGTNPSLLRAMGAATAISAFDVGFNREVLGDFGNYFRTVDELAALCAEAEANPAAAVARGAAQLVRLGAYDWDRVAASYEELAFRMVEGRPATVLAPENVS